MRPLKKICTLSIIIFALAILFPMGVSAQVTTTLPNPLGTCGTSVASFVGCVFQGVFWMSIALSVLMFLVTAFFFMTSQGEPRRIQQAKDALVWTVIGFVVVLISGGLVRVICDVLGARC